MAIIRRVKSVVPIRPRLYNADGGEFAKFILNRVQCEAG